MKREEKLELALKAAMRLRRSIEASDIPFKSLLVPAAEVKKFDDEIERLKDGAT